MTEFSVIDFSNSLYLLSQRSAHEERVAFSGGHEECVAFLNLMGAKSIANMSDGGQFWEKRHEE